jgi:putative transposase
MVFTPYDGQTLSTIMDAVKGASAHLINRAIGRRGHLWVDESFDRIIRAGENLRKKCEYICQNPVRADLVTHPDDWPWLWRCWIEGEQDSRGRLSST